MRELINKADEEISSEPWEGAEPFSSLEWAKETGKL